jgi:hypothetical protein
LHGEFDFLLQRFKRDDEECSFFELTDQCQTGYLSSGLQELSAYFSNRMSYEEVEKLIQRMTGQQALSDQGIWQGVIAKAVSVSQQSADEAQKVLKASGNLSLIVNTQLNLYNPDESEILLFEDGIQVKRQKENRNSPKQEELAEDVGSDRKRVNSDVVLFQKANGGFEYLTTPIQKDGNPLLSLELIVKAKLIDEYGRGTPETPLNIVAIVDGARSIRCRLESLFGSSVSVILDWYHLSSKVRRLMGMIAADKEQKRLHLREILPQLWCGQLSKAMDYLRTQVQARSPDTLQELLTYLEKHKSEIIDYRRRQKAGKTIGSGRVEKGVDVVVGHRQKNKGMSWSEKGSRALAVLKVVELNGDWQQLWFPKTETEKSIPG